ncbi:MAG: hypothetical protein GEV11_27130 [Streptosporangiales bacterium]|nr:hypothetical protein [Streptosporangiales bacterium]
MAEDAAAERARRYVGGWVEGFSRREDIELCTGEIVAHAVAHYPEPSDELIKIRMERAVGWEVRVIVEETRGPAASSKRAIERMGGMGYNPLAAVDAVADFWGMSISSSGFRQVWFDMIDNDPCCRFMSGGTWELGPALHR